MSLVSSSIPGQEHNARGQHEPQGRAWGSILCGGGADGISVGRSPSPPPSMILTNLLTDMPKRAACCSIMASCSNKALRSPAGNFSKAAITCRSRREINPGNVRCCLNQVAISVDRYAAPLCRFLQQALDSGGVQIGHGVL